MRLLILSDLHHELWRNDAPQGDLALSCPDAVILAGDIDTGTRAVTWAASAFAGLPVLYVHGNHEGYGHHLDKVRQELRAACAATPNVHFLDADSHVIADQAGNKVRFLGATLWTDFRLLGDDTRQAAMRDAEAVMNDYKRIRLAGMGFRKLRAADTAMFHAQQSVAGARTGAALRRTHGGHQPHGAVAALGRRCLWQRRMFARLCLAPGRPGRASGPVGAWPPARLARLPDRRVPRRIEPVRLQDAQRRAAKSRF